MNARDSILGKLRRAREGAAPVAVPAVAAWYGAAPATPGNERIAQFKSLLEAVHGEVLVAGPDHWADRLAERLIQGGIKRLLINDQCMEEQQLRQALAKRSPELRSLAYDQPIEAWKHDLFTTIDAGFTVADCAVAATGSLVLKSSALKPRTQSLVPPIHVALVHADKIHPRLIDAALAENWAGSLPTNLVLVSGPSKTSDIQQTTAYGAHGPRELIVMVVSGEEMV